MEQEYCRECGEKMKERIGVTRAIFKACPRWPDDLHDSYFTGRYVKPKFDPVTGARNADQ